MSIPPPNPKIYHITHVKNLPSIIANGGLVSDATMIASGGAAVVIGMSEIKRRRLSLPVTCHVGDNVGDSVPFYFCPRSVMLYVIHCANHPALSYRGGQEPIVHLESDLYRVIDWANANNKRWAFSLSNAGAFYTEFRADIASLADLDWDAIGNPVFRNSAVGEPKQAEFLLRDSFPWSLVERIGVYSPQYEQQVSQILVNSAHKPVVSVLQNWYF